MTDWKHDAAVLAMREDVCDFVWPLLEERPDVRELDEELHSRLERHANAVAQAVLRKQPCHEPLLSLDKPEGEAHLTATGWWLQECRKCDSCKARQTE